MTAGAPVTPAKGLPDRRRLAGSLIAASVAAAVLYGLLLAFSDPRTVVREVRHFDPVAMVAALGIVVLADVFRIARWHAYVRKAGSHPSLEASTLTFLAGFAMGVTPEKLGELVKLYYLQRHAGTPYPTSFGAAIAERVTDLVGIGLLLAAGSQALPGVDARVAPIGVVLVILGVYLVRSPRVADIAFSLFARMPLLRRGVATMRDVHACLHPLLRGPFLWAGIALAFCAWALEVVAMWVLGQGFGLHVSLTACAFVFTAASLAGALSMLPGGLGATEGGMIGLLVWLGVPLAGATALALATRLATLWFSVVVGGLAILALRGLPQPSQPASSV